MKIQVRYEFVSYFLQESKPYNKTVVPRNPGKQKKGQEPSFQVHHTGPRGKEFIKEDSARAKSLYKRRKTLFAKVNINILYSVFKVLTIIHLVNRDLRCWLLHLQLGGLLCKM